MYFTAHTVTIVCTCRRTDEACKDYVRATAATLSEAVTMAEREAECAGWDLVSNYERGGRTYAPGHAVEVAPGEWVPTVSLVKSYI